MKNYTLTNLELSHVSLLHHFFLPLNYNSCFTIKYTNPAWTTLAILEIRQPYKARSGSGNHLKKDPDPDRLFVRQFDCLCVVSNCTEVLCGRNLTQFPHQPRNSPLCGCGGDGCQSALWNCFWGRIYRHVENASLKTVPQWTLTTISTRSPAQHQRGE